MPSKDYYVILGISPTESHEGVKSAFRDLASRYHPDRAGAQSTRRFQEVSEAYNVLSDRARRTAYDASRRRAAVEPVDRPVTDVGVRAPVEPLDAGPGTYTTDWADPADSMRWSIMDDFMASYATRDQVFDHLRRNFTSTSMPKAGRLDALNLGIHLTREEARRGVDVALAVPVFLPCRNCHGSGHIGLYPCPRCVASGWYESEEDVTLRIPPMVRDGSLYQIPLAELGIEDVVIRVLIRVRD